MIRQTHRQPLLTHMEDTILILEEGGKELVRNKKLDQMNLFPGSGRLII